MAARKVVVPIWHRPPPISGFISSPLITSSGRYPAAVVNGPSFSMSDRVSPGAIRRPFSLSAPFLILARRLDGLPPYLETPVPNSSWIPKVLDSEVVISGSVTVTDSATSLRLLAKAAVSELIRASSSTINPSRLGSNLVTRLPSVSKMASWALMSSLA